MPRQLVRDDAAGRVYRVTDAGGRVIGTDQEPPTTPRTSTASLIERIDARVADLERRTPARTETTP